LNLIEPSSGVDPLKTLGSLFSLAYCMTVQKLGGAVHYFRHEMFNLNIFIFVQGELRMCVQNPLFKFGDFPISTQSGLAFLLSAVSLGKVGIGVA
jgi:hypothetical protein